MLGFSLLSKVDMVIVLLKSVVRVCRILHCFFITHMNPMIKILFSKIIIGFERYGYTFFTLLHYPNQLLLSASSAKYDWKQRPDNSTYSMRFKIESMEILNKRNKNNDPCKDNWQNYDFDILTEHVKGMKCRAPYHNSFDHFPLCFTNLKLQQAKAFSLNNMELMYPCKIAEKISFIHNFLCTYL